MLAELLMRHGALLAVLLVSSLAFAACLPTSKVNPVQSRQSVSAQTLFLTPRVLAGLHAHTTKP